MCQPLPSPNHVPINNIEVPTENLHESFSDPVSTVQRHLPRLVKAGLITIVQRRDEAGDPTSNLYTLLDTSPAAVNKRLKEMEAERGGSTEPPPSPQSATRGGSTEHYEQD